MPTFTNPYDVTTPADTESRTQGGSRLREHRAGHLERTIVEHDFPTASGSGSGRCLIPRGATSGRPTDNPAAPGGSLYIDTQIGNVVYWNGSAFVPLIVPPSANSLTASLVSPYTLTTAFANIGVSLTTLVAGTYVIFSYASYSTLDTNAGRGQVQLVGTNAFTTILLSRIGRTSSAPPPSDGDADAISGEPFIVNIPTVGTVLNMQAKTSNANGRQIIDAQLSIILLSP